PGVRLPSCEGTGTPPPGGRLLRRCPVGCRRRSPRRQREIGSCFSIGSRSAVVGPISSILGMAPGEARARGASLFDACKEGRTDVVQAWLNKGAEVDWANTWGETPLFIACQNDHREAARLLLEQGAEVDQADVDGRTPLFAACAKGQVDLARLLLGNGAEVDGPVSEGLYEGQTPLYVACGNGHVDVARLLLDKGAKGNRATRNGNTPLSIAKKNDHSAVVALLRVRRCVASADMASMSLFDACKEGRSDIVQAWLDRGADANSPTNAQGRTALHIACENGHVDAARLLLDSGAEVDRAASGLSFNGATPLLIACHNGLVDAARLLLDKGAAVNRAMNNGATPLFAACVNGHVDAARLLLEKGAAVDRATEDGATPLYAACFNGHVDAARLLLDKGAEVDRATEDGATPLYIACQNGHIDVARLLMDKGAEVDRRKENGRTPLYIACQEGHVDAARLLLDRGAKADRATKGGSTPLSIAKSKGHSAIVKLLDPRLSPVPEGCADDAADQAPAGAPEEKNDLPQREPPALPPRLPALPPRPQSLRAAASSDLEEFDVARLRSCTLNFADSRKLGEGAFGEVFAFVDSATSERFAVKRLSPALREPSADPAALAGAQRAAHREVRALSRFRHPHIVRLVGFCAPDRSSERYLVYELAAVGALDVALSDDARAEELTWRVRVRLLSGVAKALHFMHRGGGGDRCFHRDVKAANVVLTAALEPKLIDCGLALFIPKDDPRRMKTMLTATGGALGTTGYMCPKYVNSGQYGEKSEVYSFGVLLLEVIMGKIQNRPDDLANYVDEDEDEFNLAEAFDERAGEWPAAAKEELSSLGTSCLDKVRRRCDMSSVLQRLVGLAREHCAPTAEEAMLADVRRQFEALRMTGVVAAAARASQQQQCVVCFDDFDAAGGGSCGGDHSICADCLSGHVARELEVVSEDNDRLAAHRQRGGRIRCASYGGPGGCGSDYSDRTLARCLAPAVFEAYRAAQDRTVEDRIFAEAQERITRAVRETEDRIFAERLQAEENQFAEEEEAARARRQAERDRQALVEALRRDFPNARQCGGCGFGPIDHMACNNLRTHHGEQR
ncbi:unnamed protein product, partial [Pelagomonas calceolata]